MAHIHLAWELGGGLGHAGRLKTLAQALQERGHRVSLSLRDLGHTQRLLEPLQAAKFQAPVWLHRTGGMPPNQASLAEILIPAGYVDAGSLAGLAEGWRAMFGAGVCGALPRFLAAGNGRAHCRAVLPASCRHSQRRRPSTARTTVRR